MAESKDIKELRETAEVIRKKLAEARKSMASEPLVVEYQNGENQSGVRENPYFSAHAKLLKSYMSILKQLGVEVENAASDKPADLVSFGGTKWRKTS